MKIAKISAFTRKIIAAALCLALMLSISPATGYMQNVKAQGNPQYEKRFFNGNAYAIINESLYWTDAEAFCEALGGHLVTLTSAEEQTFVNSLLEEVGIKLTYWLGLSRYNTYHWRWVTGEELDYSNWAPGEPNNTGEIRGHMYSAYGTLGQWNDTYESGGSGVYSYLNCGIICEWEYDESENFGDDDNNPMGYGHVNLTVKGSDGKNLGYAVIYCDELPNVTNPSFRTKSDGTYAFYAPDGEYNLYFYAEGYLPETRAVTVSNTAHNETVILQKKDLITANATVTPLGITEIKALGIDITAPENQSVYRHNIELTYGASLEKIPVTFITNNSGEPIGKVTETFRFTDSNGKTTDLTIASIRTGGSGSHGNNDDIGEWKTNPPLAILSITTDISWLKEFYDVGLTIINNASEPFPINNAAALLTIPEGLTLADTARGESANQNMGIIAGGQTKTASWILRGDKSGDSYTVSADFSGLLMPFGINIEQTFTTESFVVYGGRALRLDIVNDIWGYGDYWETAFTLTNVSNKSVYNVNVDFSGYVKGDINLFDIADMIVDYPSNLTVTIPWNNGVPNFEEEEQFLPVFANDTDQEYEDDTKMLKPGDSLHGAYSVKKKS